MSIPVGLLGGGLALGGHYINKGPLTATTPNSRSAIHKEAELLNALDSYVKRVSPDNPITDLAYNHVDVSAIDNPSKQYDKEAKSFGGYGRTPSGVPGVTINPNAPAPLLGHELGHVAFGQTGIGSKVQNARRAMGRNPRLRNSLLAASILVPGAAAALTPGDEDLAASIAITMALDSPALIDEFEANRRSLSLMKDAGVNMNHRDRARMAGSFLSYLGKPLALAASGNLTGNMFDQDVPLTAV